MIYYTGDIHGQKYEMERFCKRFKPTKDDTIVILALRYAIHRHTYMPGVVVAFIRKYINILDRRTIEVAIRDIEEELKLGGVDDSTMWIELKDELAARIATMQPPEKK